MSPFEKLPREVRDLIYEHCLLYDGEITPFPGGYEREETERRHQVGSTTSSSSQREPMQTGGQAAFLGCLNVKREALHTGNKPCVALLGVNSTIRDEAASILFGKNIWRLSSGIPAQGDKYCLWETYATYFRHVVTRFDARDVDEAQLLDISMKDMERVEEDSDHFDQAESAKFHQEQLSLLSCLRKDNFIVKRDILLRMDLKSLSFDFSILFNSFVCCRREAIQSCLVFLGTTGPWYRLEREQGIDSETKLGTDVKVSGLHNVGEARLFWEIWGLKLG